MNTGWLKERALRERPPRRNLCFPGYVFINSPKNDNETIVKLRKAIQGINEAYFYLCYDKANKNDMALHEVERGSLQSLMDENYCVGASVGYMEGDRVKVASGALMGAESQILKVKKLKRRAVIEVEMFGSKIQITLPLEILEKA
jgi:transcription antitermination factor NusG